MRKFKFQLESALKLRRHREQQALAELGRAQACLYEAGRRFEAADAEAREARLRPLETKLMAQRDIFVHRLEVRAAQLREEMYLRAGEVEQARSRAVKAQAERKAVERLKERRLSEWRSGVQREEDRNLTESFRPQED